VKEQLGREPINGRPLYQYRVDLDHLDWLEVLLNHPSAKRSQKVFALAPVAAARFASNYIDGVPSWAHCGSEVERLYKSNPSQFRSLMEASFGQYRVPIVKRPGADLLFETVICQAGIPGGMLRQGGALRSVLDELMKIAAQGSDDLLSSASSLLQEAVSRGRLRKAYQEAGHLPKMCVDLVMAIIQLTERAGWEGGSPDSIWAIPAWDRDLPFRVSKEAAQSLVSQLLNVAASVNASSGFDIERVLSRVNGEWRLGTRAVLSGDSVELPDVQSAVVAVYYTVDNELAGEACRLRRRDGGQFAMPRPGQDLTAPAADRSVSLALKDGGDYQSIECTGGDPMDERGAWVFEPRAGEYVYKTSAPARLRSGELLVAAPEGTTVSGDAVPVPGSIVSDGVRRSFWRVTGRACFSGDDGEVSLVEAGYQGPQVYLNFKGKSPRFKVHGYANAFIGHPEPRRSGGLAGRIEWRKAGSDRWHNTSMKSVSGPLSFRLVDSEGEVLAERRRVLVFPETFHCEVGHKSVSLTLPADFRVEGGVVAHGAHILFFGQASQLQVCLRSKDVVVDVTFDRPSPTKFVDVATGQETSEGRLRTTARNAERIRARSTLQSRVYVRRATDPFDTAHAIRLHNGEMSLGQVKGFLQALAFHPRGRTHALKVEFENGPAADIEAHRVRRVGANLEVSGADADTLIHLRPLVPSMAGHHYASIELDRTDQERWRLPELSENAPLYLAVDATHQAAPCLVAAGTSEPVDERSFLGVIAIADPEARAEALFRLYKQVVGNPHDGYSSTQLDACLDWFGEFQFELGWLDPFLLLAAKPDIALRVLYLARVRRKFQAEQGLIWALEAVPFFWHRVSGHVISGAIGWADQMFGVEGRAGLFELLLELESSPIPRLLMRKSPLTPSIDRWQSTVLDWGGRALSEVTVRRPALGDASTALWREASMRGVPDNFWVMPTSVSAEVVRFSTRLCAPLELAVATALGIELAQELQDDIAYARYLIDAETFDETYAGGLNFLESL